ncbi:MAG: ABC transporter substrate-binding protein [Lysobacterales bacterium]|nr:MAG: ABC transporter substrate-binding protein [Xanthomonadales bacterium]
MRTAKIATVVLLALAGASVVAAANEPQPVHGLAMHGAPKYGPDFTHFDYVNPDAPKGGMLREGAMGTFDSFHGFIPKGHAGPASSVETLLASSADEPFTEYGLIAESMEVPEDRSWVIFTLRPEARWHDGEPITVEDVIWSLETLKTKGHPQYRFYYQNVVDVQKVGPRRVKFGFDEKNNRELPLIVGQLPILPKHYWEGRNFEATTLEPPLSSGPYRVVSFEPGRYVELERVKDYWGKDLPVNKGLYNFDRIRYEYYRDDTIMREALKAGRVDYRDENMAKAWALDYLPEKVPAIKNDWLLKEDIEHRRPAGMQAFFFNTRRDVFKDRRVRQALGYVFDFEWTNKNLFFSQYTRSQSFFSNSDLAATGLPQGEELEILERFRGKIPDDVFTTTYEAPFTDGSGWPRANLRKAFALLDEAGWGVRDQKLVNAKTGELMRFEILLVQKSIERIVLPFVRNLQRLGIDARVRLVDSSQYINRLRRFDFDMIIFSVGQGESPGTEQRFYWSSAAADSPAARNVAGIKDPVSDELIEMVIGAPDRESLVARTRALDRVLLSGHYIIPNWHAAADRVLSWNKYSRPSVIPARGTSTDYWWFDETKAQRLEQRLARETPSDQEEARTIPGVGTVILVTTALLLLGFFVFRRVMRHPHYRERH